MKYFRLIAKPGTERCRVIFFSKCICSFTMIVRTGSYTIYNGIEMQLFEIRSEVPVAEYEKQYSICYSADLNLNADGFEKHPFEEMYCKLISRSELHNGFFVQTNALYKAFAVKVFEYRPDRSRVYITTDDKTAIFQHSFFDMGDHCGKDVGIQELEKLWEERTPSQFNLPLPAGLELRKEVEV